jgi:hypothetical protein
MKGEKNEKGARALTRLEREGDVGVAALLEGLEADARGFLPPNGQRPRERVAVRFGEEGQARHSPSVGDQKKACPPRTIFFKKNCITFIW